MHLEMHKDLTEELEVSIAVCPLSLPRTAAPRITHSWTFQARECQSQRSVVARTPREDSMDWIESISARRSWWSFVLREVGREVG